MEDHIWSICMIVILLIMSAYFSATETAFTSLNRIKLKNIASDGNNKAKRVLELSENYDKLLTTILIGNNIVNIMMTAVSTVLFIELYGQYGASISTAVITVIVLIFGEISPKSLAKESPEKFAMLVGRSIKICMVILTPLNYIFAKWKGILAKVFKVGSENTITEDEIKTIVEEAEVVGGIEAEQSELIQNAIEFNELTAEEVMTPHVDIEAIDITMGEYEVAEIFKKTGYSRLPVYEDDLDKILGVLNQKDFHNYIIGSNKTISDFVKPVAFVAGTKKITGYESPHCDSRKRVRRNGGPGHHGRHHRRVGRRHFRRTRCDNVSGGHVVAEWKLQSYVQRKCRKDIRLLRNRPGAGSQYHKWMGGVAAGQIARKGRCV